MAALAQINPGSGPDQLVTECAVRVVAIAAAHFLEPYGMTGPAVEFGLLPQVALAALRNLVAGIHHRVPARVDLMTVGTTDGAGFVHAPVPVDARGVVVTAQANGILLGQRRPGISTEGTYRRPHLASPYFLRMFARGAVAGFALQYRHWRATVFDLAMPGFEYRQHRVFIVLVMAFQAGIRTLFRILGVLFLSRANRAANRHQQNC
jgi:hypothetical protein